MKREKPAKAGFEVGILGSSGPCEMALFDAEVCTEARTAQAAAGLLAGPGRDDPVRGKALHG